MPPGKESSATTSGLALDLSRSTAIRSESVSAKIVLAVLLLIALGVLYWVLLANGALTLLTNTAELREWINQLGYWGPFTIIFMMTTAIVFSPIPSGPIAMVAGAAYGSVWGTLIVVIGAEAGALIAFATARSLGYEVMQRWSRIRPLLNWLGRERSQTGLAIAVFVSRLVPFISFDAVSYAAGLTPLAFWRFLVATLAGVIPVAYLITTFGEVLITTDAGVATVALILISTITLLPLVAKLFWAWRRKRNGSSD